jgi:hypothetical protein
VPNMGRHGILAQFTAFLLAGGHIGRAPGGGGALAGSHNVHFVLGYVDRVGQLYGKQQWVDTIGSRGNDGHLWPWLAAA